MVLPATPAVGRLSVVVPAYGVEAYLSACLTSVLDQDCVGEVVVVIDASPDACEAVARRSELQDARVSVIVNTQNVGIGASRNIGARAASCDYIVFVDSDDLVASGAHATMIEWLDQSGSDFATSMADEFGTQVPGRKRYWTVTAPIFREGVRSTTIEEHPELIRDHTVWTKVYRRRFLEETGIRWAEGTSCEEVVASVALCVAARSIDVVPVISYLYRRRPGSVTAGLTSGIRLGDWGRQTAASLNNVPSTLDPQVLQQLISKVLSHEVMGRLPWIRQMDECADRNAALECLKTLVTQAEAPTLLTQRPPMLRSLGTAILAEAGELPTEFRTVCAALGVNFEGHESHRPDQERSIDVLPSHSTPEGRTALLSVVLQCHNDSVWIDDAVRSVLEQTLRTLELVCVDDNSSDDTWDRLQAWAGNDDRVRTFRSPGDGPAAARNHGVRHAAGDYLTFVDGDDLVPTKAHESMLNALCSTGDELLVADYQHFTPTSTRHEPINRDVSEPTAHRTWLESGRHLVHRVPWGMMFSTSYWKRQGLAFVSVTGTDAILATPDSVIGASGQTLLRDISYHHRLQPGDPGLTGPPAEPAKLCKYLRQEAVAAKIITDQAPEALAREYWYVARRDLWRHVDTVLTAHRRKPLDASLLQEISAAVTQLWMLMPSLPKPVLGPEQQLSVYLFSRSEIDQASVMGQLAKKTPGSATSAQRFLRAVMSTTISDELIDTVLQSFRTQVLNPVVASGSSWERSELQQVVNLSALLSERVSLLDVPAPESEEFPLIAALVSGDVEQLLGELQSQRPPLEVSASAAVRGGGASLTARPAPGSGVVIRLELHGMPRKGQQPPRILASPTDPAGCTAMLRPGQIDSLGVGTCEASAICWDSKGWYQVPVEFTGHVSLHWSAVRVREGKLHILPRGLDRAQQAFSWRVKKVRRAAGRIRRHITG